MSSSPCPKPTLVLFLHDIMLPYNLYFALKFTWTISNRSLHLTRQTICWHLLQTHWLQQLPSLHPISCKDTILFTHFLNLRHVSSGDEVLHSRPFQLMGRLGEGDLAPITSFCTSAFTPAEVILLVLTFHPPASASFFNIFVNYYGTHYQWHHPHPCAFCWNHSIHDSRVCSSLCSHPSISLGIFPLKPQEVKHLPLYLLSPSSRTSNTISGEAESYKHVTSNHVYCIQFSRCGFLYISETECRWGNCFDEYLRSVNLAIQSSQ